MVTKLPPAQREVVTLRYLRELSIKEVSDLTGKNRRCGAHPAASRPHVVKARARRERFALNDPSKSFEDALWDELAARWHVLYGSGRAQLNRAAWFVGGGVVSALGAAGRVLFVHRKRAA